MPAFGTCPTSSVEGGGQGFVRQCLSLLLCPPGSLLVAVVPPLLASSYSSAPNVRFLPAPPTTLLPLFPCQTYLRVTPQLCLFEASARLRLLFRTVQPHAAPSPAAQKVPLDFSPNVGPAAVLRGRTFLLPFFQFGLRW